MRLQPPPPRQDSVCSVRWKRVKTCFSIARKPQEIPSMEPFLHASQPVRPPHLSTSFTKWSYQTFLLKNPKTYLLIYIFPFSTVFKILFSWSSISQKVHSNKETLVNWHIEKSGMDKLWRFFARRQKVWMLVLASRNTVFSQLGGKQGIILADQWGSQCTSTFYYFFLLFATLVQWLRKTWFPGACSQCTPSATNLVWKLCK